MHHQHEWQYPSMHIQAYRFFPVREQEKIGWNKSNGSRVYFYGQIEHDDFEKKKLLEFKEHYAKKHGKNFESEYFNDHKLVLFLSSNSFKFDQAIDSMKKHEEFRAQYVATPDGEKIIKYETDPKVRQLVDRGCFYICGRDQHFRPTMVFNMTKIDFKDCSVNLRTIIYVQEVVIEKMFIPGQVQSWNIIYDLGGLGITDVPVTQLKGALQLISSNYGGRLYRLWLLNSPTTIYFSWKVVKNFLDPVTVEKINIVKKNTDESLWKIFHKSQIQQKYGGTQPNRDSYFPFKLPPAVYDERRIISEQKYEQLHLNGVLTRNQLCPRYTEKLKKKEQKKVMQLAEQELKAKQKLQEEEKKSSEKKQQVKKVQDTDEAKGEQKQSKTEQISKQQKNESEEKNQQTKNELVQTVNEKISQEKE